MQEIYDNLFQETISYSDRHMSPRNLYPVSYTHLDVYKRQVQHVAGMSGSGTIVAINKDCLLYTSTASIRPEESAMKCWRSSAVSDTLKTASTARLSVSTVTAAQCG